MTERPDPIEQLRNLKPFAAGPGDSIEQQEAKWALFEEVTMQTATPSVDDGTRSGRAPKKRPTPWWRRPRMAIPTLAGTLALIVAVAFGLNAISAPSALAAVTEATERAGAFRSGVVDLVVDVRQAEGLDDRFTVEATYQYDGDDFRFEVLPPESDQPVELRSVGGVEYAYVGGTWFSSADPRPGDFDIQEALGFSIESVDPAAVLTLIQAADDVTEVGTSDGGVTYRATVPAAEVVALGTEGLPMGISAVLSGLDPADELPDELTVTLESTNGVLSYASLEMAGDTAAAGYLDATITAGYSQLGVPQTITAPDANEVQDFPAVDVAELEEAAAILGEVENRRPGLCKDVEDGYLGTDPAGFDPSVIPQLIDAMATCYTDAGEPAAAAAYRTLMSMITSGG